MEAAIERKHARMFKSQIIGIATVQKHIDTSVAGCVKSIVANHSVVISIVIDPLDRLTCTNRHGKRREAIFPRYVDKSHRLKRAARQSTVTHAQHEQQ